MQSNIVFLWGEMQAYECIEKDLEGHRPTGVWGYIWGREMLSLFYTRK